MGSAAVCEAGSNYASRVGFDLTRICLPLLGLKVYSTIPDLKNLYFKEEDKCDDSGGVVVRSRVRDQPGKHESPCLTKK